MRGSGRFKRWPSSVEVVARLLGRRVARVGCGDRFLSRATLGKLGRSVRTGGRSLVFMARRRMGECCLCGTHALLEDEDVYPIWARNQVRGKLAEPPLNGQWPAKLLIKTCEGCNRGLGDEFENPVSKI